MTTQGRPVPRRAIIYNQDELYDFAKGGGSVGALFEEAVGGGNHVVITREPSEGVAAVVMLLKGLEDISRWEEYRLKMHDWRERVLGNPAIVTSGDRSKPVQDPTMKLANDKGRKTTRG